ncbi:riboflavin synthase [Desulfotomaculum copahuensis]|uniref:Riboflavin synthase n=1 Tax=Desulfotomaculum copahuensis TaxID=1838280 RepID=A0A1B7LEM3_9FIRM|nr:riboflavin synthase [Desulfotomaculum copahuensis]OAT81723.1 riboflavin synthase subunit alpha [Desulfotomaculum copahuensis]
MFTGLVEELGGLKKLTRGTDSARLHITARKVLDGLAIGDSVAVNGVCLTVVARDEQSFAADVMAETLAKSNLGALSPGRRVNLERALRLGGRLGGHLVSGHIDGVGTITRREEHDIAVLVTIGAPPEVMRYVVKKGSVAVDGISLTVVDLDAAGFQVSLIPHTAGATTLGFKKPGDTVNLEADLIGKYVEKLLSNRENAPSPGGVSMNFLVEHGFA